MKEDGGTAPTKDYLMILYKLQSSHLKAPHKRLADDTVNTPVPSFKGTEELGLKIKYIFWEEKHIQPQISH